jgi:hypothetical protein
MQQRTETSGSIMISSAYLSPLRRITGYMGGGDGKWAIWADFSFSSRAVSFAVT